jgi:CheY-like chemotaxis protein
MTLIAPLKILVVEDWPEVRELVVGVFTDAGFNVSEACNWQEARSMFEVEPPHIVITDYFLPDKAEDFVQWVKQRYPRIAIIVLSADPQEATLSMPDADVVLGKPISLAKLVQTVLHFVDLVKAERSWGGAPN